MKMPFGKYKGTQVKKLPYDYLCFLQTINLYGNLKTEVNDAINTDEYRNLRNSRYEHSLEKDYEIDYSKDLRFWSTASPNAAFDYLIKTGKRDSVDIDDWRFLCSQCNTTLW